MKNTKLSNADTHADGNDLKNFMKCDIFTPDNISKLMSSKLKNSGSLLEPSAGIGNLLKYIDLTHYSTIDLYELKKEYTDILHQNMTLEKETNNLSIYNCDFLKTNIENRFDNIIMNPPYIKIQDLSEEYRDFIKTTFPVLESGLVDIYYAFIVKCIQLLKTNGVLVSITPNSFLYNKSAFKLRKYLFENHYIEEIIDFNEKKIFKGVNVYCCITIFRKSTAAKKNLIYNNKVIPYSSIKKNYSLFQLEEVSTTILGSLCIIKNGIATLRDKIYIHSKKIFEEPCWKEITNGMKKDYIIYPYKNGKIIKEEEFMKENPDTYHYLLEHKEELARRDKGKKKYSTWYAFGRTQSILYDDSIESIYIPSFIHPDNIKDYLHPQKGILHRSCLCITPKKYTDMPIIVETIEKNIDFIVNNSQKRSGGWINLSTRILKQISI